MRMIQCLAVAASLFFVVALLSTVTGGEQKPVDVTEAEKKIRDLAEQLNKTRTAALKQLEEAEKQAREAMNKANEQFRKAGGDQEAYKQAREAITRATAQMRDVQKARSEIQRYNVFGFATAAVSVREEDRLGARFGPPNATLAKQLGLNEGEGLVIEKSPMNSPAAKAGLQDHDVLVTINGKTVPSNIIEFRKVLADIKADAAVDAEVIRAGKKQTVNGVTIPAQPQRSEFGIRPFSVQPGSINIDRNRTTPPEVKQPVEKQPEEKQK